MLRNADGSERVSDFPGRCKVQCYLHYEGVGGGPISRKKRYVTLEWPLILYTARGMKLAILSNWKLVFHILLSE